MAGSSSGKSGIARCLQAVLPDPWLAFGVDTLIQAMPVSSPMSAPGLQITSDGAVTVGPEFRRLEGAWIEGVAAMAHAGAQIILDEVPRWCGVSAAVEAGTRPAPGAADRRPV
jgi:chloramphenicol 3-O phosphotransferase